nr:hypothetical protein [uncultured Brevundimonas sp.]
MSRIDAHPPLYRYAVFGLCVETDLHLPELEEAAPGQAADVQIRRGDAPNIVEGAAAAAFRFEDDEALLSWREVGAFRVRGSDLIEYRPVSGADPALVSLPLLGPVMGVLLERRGLLTLHGSAVALSAGVVIFLGDKGAGKSTTAAALIRAGKSLLTDDIVALDCGSTPTLYPAYSQVKLTDEANGSIDVGAQLMRRPHPAFEKNRLRVDAPFNPAPRRPMAALVLDRGARFEIRRLSGPDALTALMRFSYATRFGRALMRGQAAADHLQHCAALSRTIAVCRLTVPDDLAALAELPAWLETEMQRLDEGVHA